MSEETASALVAKHVPFPRDEWLPSCFAYIGEPTKFLPLDWRARIQLKDPNGFDIVEECEAAIRAVQTRTPALIAEINEQAASDDAAAWLVQLVVGNPYDPFERQFTNKLVRAVLNEVWGPIFYFKFKFNRGRPYHCCDRRLLDPMFPRYSDRLYPGYAAYPSGHSTQVHAVAYLYARMFPALEPRLLAAAQRVAGNREVAGLHFATDTQAGRDMARQIIDLIWGREEFQAMIANARIEWPEH